MCYNKRVRLKKRLPARVKEPLSTPESPNHTWSMGFVSDTLNSGRKFRVLNVLDDFNREAIAQEISNSMPYDAIMAPSSSIPNRVVRHRTAILSDLMGATAEAY